MTVLVRKSRYTHCLIDKADNFTVSLAFDGYDEVFDFCGTKSGRDYDKFKECSITTSPGEKVTSPVIKEFDLHFECKIVFKQDMNPNDLTDEYKNACYPSGDYHTIYYGQIMGCYIK